MPPACPRCHKYEWLTSPALAEIARDKGFNAVVCENCNWQGEYDNLDEIDGD